jgi:hypothetical protein
MDSKVGLYSRFWAQVVFSAAGIGFSSAMLLRGSDASVYLPVFTSILFAWLPSPLSNFPPKAITPTSNVRSEAYV